MRNALPTRVGTTFLSSTATHNQKRPQVASPNSLRSRAMGEMRSIDIGEATCGRFFFELIGLWRRGLRPLVNHIKSLLYCGQTFILLYNIAPLRRWHTAGNTSRSAGSQRTEYKSSASSQRAASCSMSDRWPDLRWQRKQCIVR